MKSNKVGYFISAHGFGHASRSAAVIDSLSDLSPEMEFHIFTAVPDWFFNPILTKKFKVHPVQVDVGVAQISAMQEDLPETVRRLDAFLPFTEQTIRPLVEEIRNLNLEMIICDISPLGITAARLADIPAILIENFTWDWIYQGYLSHEPGLEPYIQPLKQIFGQADYHIQTHPVCAHVDRVDLYTRPVARKSRLPRKIIRQQLEIPESAQVVLVTMGGIQEKYAFLNSLPDTQEIYYVIPGSSDEFEAILNQRRLPHHSDFFHPDLVGACDAVIGKVGYSTLSEAYHAGLPFGYVARDKLPESPHLVKFVQNEMKGIEISNREFASGDWTSYIPAILALGHSIPDPINGADQIANFIQEMRLSKLNQY